MQLEVCRKILGDGKSKVFEDWKKLLSWQGYDLSETEFLDAIKWLCDDPRNGDKNDRKLTREIGLEKDGIARLQRVYDPDDLCAFYKDKFLWSGSCFRVPCNNPNFAGKDGMCVIRLELCLSMMDRI